MNISKLSILFLCFIACCVASCDSATEPTDTSHEFDSLKIFPAPGYYPVGSTLTMSFSGVNVDTTKYIYRWTVNDTMVVDSLTFLHKFEFSGRHILTLRIYSKNGQQFISKASSVLLFLQNYLSPDSLIGFSKFKVEFGGFGRLEVRKDTSLTYIDTIFSLGSTGLNTIGLWSEVQFLANEGSSYFVQTRFTQSDGSDWTTCHGAFDSLLQVLTIDSLSKVANSGRWESVSNGILTGSGGYSFKIKSMTLLISKVSSNEVVFEMPENDIPLAMKYIVYGSGINAAFNGYNNGWGSNLYKVLTSIDATNSIIPYLRLTFRK